MVFLGILLDGVNKCLCVPVDKKNKAINCLNLILDSKAVTVKQVQRLMGVLNFIAKAIVPGHAFTRRMYAKIKLVNKHGMKLKDYHHVKWIRNLGKIVLFGCLSLVVTKH